MELNDPIDIYLEALKKAGAFTFEDDVRMTELRQLIYPRIKDLTLALATNPTTKQVDLLMSAILTSSSMACIDQLVKERKLFINYETIKNTNKKR